MDIEEYDEVISQLDYLMPHLGETFTELFGQIIRGEEEASFQTIWSMIVTSAQNSMTDLKSIFISLVLLSVAAAVIGNFSKIFKNKQVASLSFYFVYLMLINVLLQGFYLSLNTAVSLIENIVRFTEILIPTFYLAVATSSAATTAASFYQFTLLLVYIAQVIFPEIIIPLVTCYVFATVMNGISEEERFSGLINLLRKSIHFLIKLSMGAVTGIGMIKSMVTPVIDKINITALKKTVAVIPGIGDIAESASEVVIGSALLVKNSLGMLFLILLVLVCIPPICKIFFLSASLQIAAACMGLLSEKRTAECTERVAEGGFLLLKASLAVAAMLFITVAIVSAAT